MVKFDRNVWKGTTNLIASHCQTNEPIQEEACWVAGCIEFITCEAMHVYM